MNIVGHSTMYFKPFFFEAQVYQNNEGDKKELCQTWSQVSVNLTVMLVLTTMFVRQDKHHQCFNSCMSTKYKESTFICHQ